MPRCPTLWLSHDHTDLLTPPITVRAQCPLTPGSQELSGAQSGRAQTESTECARKHEWPLPEPSRHVRGAQGHRALLNACRDCRRETPQNQCIENQYIENMPQQAKPGSAKKARRKAAKGKDAELVPHYSVLACEYHVSIVAGLSLIGLPLSPALLWCEVSCFFLWLACS